MNDLLSPTTWALALLLVSALVLLALTILHRRREVGIRVREISAFTDLQDQLGRAAESGKPFHIALGTGGLGSGSTVSSLAGLQLLEGIVDAAVAYDVVPVVTVGDPTLLPLAQDVLRRAYERNQIPESYDSSQVRFLGPSPTVYAAGAVPVGAPEDVTLNVALGTYGPEATLIADISNRHGKPMAAAVDSAEAIGALFPAVRRLAAGEELYATGAQVTDDKKFVASLITEDILRLMLVLIIVVLSLVALIGG